MKKEVNSAVTFLTKMLSRGHNVTEEQCGIFQNTLIDLLCRHYDNHWFPEKPFKGSGYRCIRINHKVDPMLEKAGLECGLSKDELLSRIPNELTIWVDPEDVSYRFGENGSIGVLLAKEGGLKEDKVTSTPKKQQKKQVRTPTPTSSPTPSYSPSRQSSSPTYNQSPAYYSPRRQSPAYSPSRQSPTFDQTYNQNHQTQSYEQNQTYIQNHQSPACDQSQTYNHNRQSPTYNQSRESSTYSPRRLSPSFGPSALSYTPANHLHHMPLQNQTYQQHPEPEMDLSMLEQPLGDALLISCKDQVLKYILNQPENLEYLTSFVAS